MKKLLFCSDFDGTITQRDFYKLLMSECIGQDAIDYFNEVRRKEKIGIKVLDKIFRWRKFSEQEIQGVLDKIPFDSTFLPFYESFVGDVDFLIVSAGFEYYIKLLLKREGMSEIELIANTGNYEDGWLNMTGDKSLSYYSPVYGIDKAEVIRQQKKRYETVVFVGDSEPDYWAALEADVVFAKDELVGLMDANEQPCIPITQFSDITSWLNRLLEETRR